MTDFPHRAPRVGDLVIPFRGDGQHRYGPGDLDRVSEVDRMSVAYGTRIPGMHSGWRCVASQIGKRRTLPYLLPGDRVLVGCAASDHATMVEAGRRQTVEVRRAQAACKAAIAAAAKAYQDTAAAIQERIEKEEESNAQ